MRGVLYTMRQHDGKQLIENQSNPTDICHFSAKDEAVFV